MTIEAAAAALRSGKISAVELARESLRRIQQQQPRLNAFITVTEEIAFQQARRADKELAQGIDRGMLHGIPYALKDNFETAGIRTTCGSKIFADYVPKRNSAVYEQLTEAGAVLMGKTGMHELAYGITSNNPHFGAIRNPHDPERIPGGSSGGSGAAVAADLVCFAMGSDTGGSIRIPAAYCGCVGFKPAAGAISRRGLMPLSPTLDHAGPLTQSVGDLIHVMNAFCPPTGPVPPLKGLRVGVPENFFVDGLSPAVARAFGDAVATIANAGCEIVSVHCSDAAEINLAGRIILLSEAPAVLESHLDRRADFGSDVLALLDQGREVRATEYIRARRYRLAAQRRWGRMWENCDLMITPTVAIQAPVIGEESVNNEDVRLASTKFVRPFNVLGFPAISVRTLSGGLPAGLQIVTRPGDEAILWAVSTIAAGQKN
jgi:aspartyl-tRNA(Asn)/glutamyl-tRNA(Gln) amidotransferase subunit A